MRGLLLACSGTAALLVAQTTAQAASLPSRRAAPPPPALAECPYDVPDDVTAPVAAADDGSGSSGSGGKASAAAGNGDDSDDDDDDDDDDNGGYRALDGCLSVGGEIDAGVTLSWLRIKGLAGAFDRGRDITVYDTNGTFNLGHVTQSPYGEIITRLSVQVFRGSAELSEASIQVGPVIAGLETSFFDSWSADEFSFRALASSQSPTILGLVWRPSDASTVSLSMEDPVFRRVTVTGYGAPTVPDLIGRLRYTAAPFDFTLSGALHQTRLSRPEDGAIQGVAALASLKVSLPTANDGSYVIAQAAWADKAPGYLGINTTSSVFRLPIGGILDAGVAERGRGWNAAGVVNWQFAPTWSSAAFVSGVSLDVPGTLGTGRFRSMRSAANITWEPVDSFSITAEVGYARFRSGTPLLPSSSSLSTILSFSRTF